jgi:short-subunit dehydrogenase
MYITATERSPNGINYQTKASRDTDILPMCRLSGLIPQPGNTPYSTAKWGLVGFSLASRFEGADLGVKASCVCPADMKTDIHKNMTVVKMDLATIERDSRRTHFLLRQWSAAHAATRS